MRSVHVSKPKGPFEIIERDVPEPDVVQVPIIVQACGICHSDSFTKEGLFPGMQYPRVPAHERHETREAEYMIAPTEAVLMLSVMVIFEFLDYKYNVIYSTNALQLLIHVVTNASANFS